MLISKAVLTGEAYSASLYMFSWSSQEGVNNGALHCAQARQKARASGQEFMDRSVMSGRFPMSLPQALLPRGQLTPAQQLVYEDFARIPRTAPGQPPFPMGASPDCLTPR